MVGEQLADGLSLKGYHNCVVTSGWQPVSDGVLTILGSVVFNIFINT